MSVGDGDIPTALPPDQYAPRFSEVVNLVDDFGADPSGEHPIDAPLRQAWDNDRLIVLPEGEYKMNRPFRRTSTSNVGLIGQNALIRHGRVEAIEGHTVDQGEYTGSTMMFRIGTSTNPHGDLVFGGLIFDWGWHANAGMQGLNAFIDGEAEIRNIVFHGTHSLGSFANLRVATAEPDSVALVDSVDMRGGGLHYIDTINTREERRYDEGPEHPDFGQSWGSTGFTGHPDQQGTTVIRNMICGPWPDNTIYPRGGSGRKIVSGCIVWDGGGSQIRTNGGDDWEPVEWLDGTDNKDEALDGPYPGSVIEQCHVVIETNPDGVYINPRGILLQDGPQLVRDCEIEIAYAEGGGAGGTYGFGTRGEGGESPAGPAVVENSRITLYENANAIYVSPYTNSIEFHDIEINTVGWEAGLNRLVGGTGADQLENVIVNAP
ncbi:hypothetical protein [Saliphagus infecundisoli]|uniref:Pectate lyase superfamily protein domain-containing protein n=1 Tax=Saliphagus infecundisoli TaxID=1849069 RepID=A0ABD5QLF5_9EURY|nr:hypothetical protein [Saliphagus infecundisoli]